MSDLSNNIKQSESASPSTNLLQSQSLSGQNFGQNAENSGNQWKEWKDEDLEIFKQVFPEHFENLDYDPEEDLNQQNEEYLNEEGEEDFNQEDEEAINYEENQNEKEVSFDEFDKTYESCVCCKGFVTNCGGEMCNVIGCCYCKANDFQ